MRGIFHFHLFFILIDIDVDDLDFCGIMRGDGDGCGLLERVEFADLHAEIP